MDDQLVSKDVEEGTKAKSGMYARAKNLPEDAVMVKPTSPLVNIDFPDLNVLFPVTGRIFTSESGLAALLKDDDRVVADSTKIWAQNGVMPFYIPQIVTWAAEFTPDEDFSPNFAVWKTPISVDLIVSPLMAHWIQRTDSNLYPLARCVLFLHLMEFVYDAIFPTCKSPEFKAYDMETYLPYIITTNGFGWFGTQLLLSLVNIQLLRISSVTRIGENYDRQVSTDVIEKLIGCIIDLYCIGCSVKNVDAAIKDLHDLVQKNMLDSFKVTDENRARKLATATELYNMLTSDDVAQVSAAYGGLLNTIVRQSPFGQFPSLAMTASTQCFLPAPNPAKALELYKEYSDIIARVQKKYPHWYE